eukprot:COSAG04_NODE_6069_length_1417_cov_2.070561_1_plen_459_part_01
MGIAVAVVFADVPLAAGKVHRLKSITRGNFLVPHLFFAGSRNVHSALRLAKRCHGASAVSLIADALTHTIVGALVHLAVTIVAVLGPVLHVLPVEAGVSRTRHGQPFFRAIFIDICFTELTPSIVQPLEAVTFPGEWHICKDHSDRDSHYNVPAEKVSQQNAWRPPTNGWTVGPSGTGPAPTVLFETSGGMGPSVQAYMDRVGLGEWRTAFETCLPLQVQTVKALRTITAEDLRRLGHRANLVLRDGTISALLEALNSRFDEAGRVSLLSNGKALDFCFGFGPAVSADYCGAIVAAEPRCADSPLTNAAAVRGKLALMHSEPGQIASGANRLAMAGAVAVLVVDNKLPSNEPLAPSDSQLYAEAQDTGHRVDSTNVRVGLRVVRGADWTYDDQDGGEGRGGAVIGFTAMDGRGEGEASTGWATVEWDGGGENSYEIGADGEYALKTEESVTTESSDRDE